MKKCLKKKKKEKSPLGAEASKFSEVSSETFEGRSRSCRAARLHTQLVSLLQGIELSSLILKWARCNLSFTVPFP